MPFSQRHGSEPLVAIITLVGILGLVDDHVSLQRTSRGERHGAGRTLMVLPAVVGPDVGT